jgi:hypothetical protein
MWNRFTSLGSSDLFSSFRNILYVTFSAVANKQLSYILRETADLIHYLGQIKFKVRTVKFIPNICSSVTNKFSK